MVHEGIDANAANESETSASLKESGADAQEVEIATAIEWCSRDLTKSCLQHVEEAGCTMSISEWAKGQLLLREFALNDNLAATEAQAWALGRSGGSPTTR